MKTGQPASRDLLFEVLTLLGFTVRVTKRYWQLIVDVKHPVVLGQEETVKKALSDPDVIRQSRRDPGVYLFYVSKRPGRWMCAVARRENDADGFLITAYPTDAIKEGEKIWPR
jgi:phage pi2 protein 07